MMTLRDIHIAVLSDLHLDIRRRHLVRDGLSEAACAAALADLQEDALREAASADLVVLAGDIGKGTDGIRWAAEAFAGRPAVYVAGNHEFYRHCHDALIGDLRRAAAQTANVRFLEKDAVELELHARRLRVLGCTAWTDYRLYGPEGAGEAMRQAQERMYDHRRIGFNGGFLSPEDAAGLHANARAWLAAELARPFPGATVVVTHHAPGPLSIEPRFQGDALSPAFASDMTALMRDHAPALWLHGHTHHNVDYAVGRTRVVSHQWGYPAEDLSRTAKLVTI